MYVHPFVLLLLPLGALVAALVVRRSRSLARDIGDAAVDDARHLVDVFINGANAAKKAAAAFSELAGHAARAGRAEEYDAALDGCNEAARAAYMAAEASRCVTKYMERTTQRAGVRGGKAYRQVKVISAMITAESEEAHATFQALAAAAARENVKVRRH